MKNALPVLTYIAMHPGCIQEDVRKATVKNNGTLRKILNTLIETEMIKEVNCRDKDYTGLTTYFYASPLAVNVGFSYQLVLQSLSGLLDSNDPTFNVLMEERFNGAYQRALESARNIPKSDS